MRRRILILVYILFFVYLPSFSFGTLQPIDALISDFPSPQVLRCLNYSKLTTENRKAFVFRTGNIRGKTFTQKGLIYNIGSKYYVKGSTKIENESSPINVDATNALGINAVKKEIGFNPFKDLSKLIGLQKVISVDRRIKDIEIKY